MKKRGWLALLLTMALGGQAFGGGAVEYEDKGGFFGDGDGERPVVRLPVKAGEKLKLSVLPLSFTAADDPGVSAKTGDEAWLKEAWKTLEKLAGEHASFEVVALPAEAEQDEAIGAAMKYAAGLTPVSEFKKIKKFALPERFLYGNATVSKVVEQRASGPDKVSYRAEVFLRLVDGATLKYLASDGTSTAGDVDGAVKAALKKALVRYQPEEKQDSDQTQNQPRDQKSIDADKPKENADAKTDPGATADKPATGDVEKKASGAGTSGADTVDGKKKRWWED